jgi:hypothetical protein
LPGATDRGGDFDPYGWSLVLGFCFVTGDQIIVHGLYLYEVDQRKLKVDPSKATTELVFLLLFWGLYAPALGWQSPALWVVLNFYSFQYKAGQKGSF